MAEVVGRIACPLGPARDEPYRGYLDSKIRGSHLERGAAMPAVVTAVYRSNLRFWLCCLRVFVDQSVEDLPATVEVPKNSSEPLTWPFVSGP